MLSKPAIGRPPKDKVEDEFKECVRRHLPRNMLECRTFERTYTKFMSRKEDLKEVEDSVIEAYFIKNYEP